MIRNFKAPLITLCYLLVSGCQSTSEAPLKKYNENMLFLKTGARPDDKPSFPNPIYNTQLNVWLNFLRLQKEGAILSLFKTDGLSECELPEKTKYEIIGHESSNNESQMDLLDQINSEAINKDSLFDSENKINVYAENSTCNNIASGQPISNARVLIKYDLVRPNTSGLKTTQSFAFLYEGEFGKNLTQLDRSSVLSTSSIKGASIDTLNPWEMSYLIKITKKDHVKFMDGTPYTYDSAYDLDGVLKSIYSETTEDGRTVEKTFYGHNLIQVNRFLNNRAHGPQEYFYRDSGYKYTCYKNGSKMVISKDDCEQL